MQRRLASSILATVLVAIGTGTAQAAIAFGSLPLALAAATSLEQGRCAMAAMPAYGVTASVPREATSKASAILGGQISALDAMRLQQAAATPTEHLQFASIDPPGTGMNPRSGGECSKFIMPRGDFAQQQPGRSTKRDLDGFASDDFLASKRLRVERTAFDAQWNRVRRDSVSGSTIGAIAGGVSSRPNVTTLTAVNSWVNLRIRYVEDRDLYGKADYWAGAKSTLRRRAGDCEDIALAKMALLAALGVPRDAMFLTIARDLARNADHALLVVKLDSRHWLLDNAMDQLLDARASYDYRPILSYSEGKKWLHGY